MVNNCPLCKSKKIRMLQKEIWTEKNTDVFYCENCTVTFLSPFMSEEEEKKYYSDYNRHAKKRGVIATQSPEALHSQSKEASVKRLAKIDKYFGKGKEVLEVGSSTGAFLELLKDNKCFAVEPSVKNRKFSEQFCVKTYSDISKIEKNKKFDIICMFHTLEHIKDPVNFLLKCKGHLGRRGLLIIEVPCISDPLLSIYACDKYRQFYFQPMHPFIHSTNSLEYISKSLDFNDREIIYYQRYGLPNHLNWLAFGKPGGSKTFSDLFNPITGYESALEKSGFSDTIIIICKNR